MNLVQNSNTSEAKCLNTNFVYGQYVSYVYLSILTDAFPMIINILFGSLAYRTMPLVQRELDKQLTSMVLVQVIYSVIVTLPYIYLAIIMRSTTLAINSSTAEKLNFVYLLADFLYYMYFIVSN